MRYMPKEQVEEIKAEFPPGTRLILHEMKDDPMPVEPGTKGTVTHVDAIGTIHCEFDNGRCLGVCPEVDIFEKIIGE